MRYKTMNAICLQRETVFYAKCDINTILINIAYDARTRTHAHARGRCRRYDLAEGRNTACKRGGVGVPC